MLIEERFSIILFDLNFKANQLMEILTQTHLKYPAHLYPFMHLFAFFFLLSLQPKAFVFFQSKFFVEIFFSTA